MSGDDDERVTNWEQSQIYVIYTHAYIHIYMYTYDTHTYPVVFPSGCVVKTNILCSMCSMCSMFYAFYAFYELCGHGHGHVKFIEVNKRICCHLLRKAERPV
jgi:hypothetical protein